MYKLTVFIPEANLEQVKHALFEAGAGHIGNYSQFIVKPPQIQRR